jgi:hypothetical protein
MVNTYLPPMEGMRDPSLSGFEAMFCVEDRFRYNEICIRRAGRSPSESLGAL